RERPHVFRGPEWEIRAAAQRRVGIAGVEILQTFDGVGHGEDVRQRRQAGVEERSADLSERSIGEHLDDDFWELGVAGREWKAEIAGSVAQDLCGSRIARDLSTVRGHELDGIAIADEAQARRARDAWER